MKKATLFILTAVLFCSCSENYSNGERIGFITQFSRAGNIWKSWEGHLNMSQTGMNSSQAFDFSIDNDAEPTDVIKTIDSAALNGWKVKLTYHETTGKNWFKNRGATSHFITGCQVLDREPMKNVFGGGGSLIDNVTREPGRVDTIYLVIYRDAQNAKGIDGSHWKPHSTESMKAEEENKKFFDSLRSFYSPSSKTLPIK